MRKSVRGALVGAALLPLAAAAPGMAFAAPTDAEGITQQGQSAGDNVQTDESKVTDDSTQSESPTLPEPFGGAAEMITGMGGASMLSSPNLAMH